MEALAKFFSAVSSEFEHRLAVMLEAEALAGEEED